MPLPARLKASRSKTDVLDSKLFSRPPAKSCWVLCMTRKGRLCTAKILSLNQNGTKGQPRRHNSGKTALLSPWQKTPDISKRRQLAEKD